LQVPTSASASSSHFRSRSVDYNEPNRQCGRTAGGLPAGGLREGGVSEAGLLSGKNLKTLAVGFVHLN